MPLLKPQTLPIVIHDFANRIDVICNNSTLAIGTIHAYTQADPPGVEFNELVGVLARSVFKYGESTLPAKLDNLKVLGLQTRRVSEAYWPIYSYLFALLPDYIESRRVDGERWSLEEYEQLTVSIFSRWSDAHQQNDDAQFLAGYVEMRKATQAWFKRRDKLAAARKFCVDKVTSEIQATAPKISGSIAQQAFRKGVETFLDLVDDGFYGYVKSYWYPAAAFHFFARDSASLPAHIAGDCEEKEHLQK